ncbi:MAG TPA: type II toxin-antitoxin system VapB family antitoxin [Candidatus Competibacteraceae bacterium]|nr:type II toxin-antitoxin system VapB family antitoxin [Candidatus Competibacteraceae bacterium]
MSLHIEAPETDCLAREFAAATGESLTEAMRRAVAERLARESGKTPVRLRDEIMAIATRCAALPDLSTATPDQIIGYDKSGLPH